MRRLVFLCVLFVGCKTLTISHDITDRESYRLLKQAEENPELYKIDFNTDSTYVLCTLNDNSQQVNEPITFMIVGTKKKEKILVSINEYHKARWIDNENILFTSYTGAPGSGRNMNKLPGSGIKEYIFNVTSKQIRSGELKTENN